MTALMCEEWGKNPLSHSLQGQCRQKNDSFCDKNIM